MENPITGSIDSSGFKLRYSIEGNGPIVLIPGSVLYDQRSFSQQLRQHLRLIFLDHRGFVPPPKEEVTISAFELEVLLNDIEMARLQLGLENFFILGHSGHGFLAIEYAKKFPEHVTGIVMVASAPSNSDARRRISNESFEKKASPERRQLFGTNMSELPGKLTVDPENRFMHFLLASAPQSWYDPTFDASPLWKGVYTNMQAIDHIWGKVFRDIDITSGLDQLWKPVLLMLGKYDFLTGPPEVWDEIKNKFRDLTIQLFDKSAHCPQLEEAEMFNNELLKWISSLASH